MASMILSTNPDRRIIQVSPELAEAVGTDVRFMVGVDCADILRCRNADGEPLCNSFCPALMTARKAWGNSTELPIWLEKPSGKLRAFDGTFQQVASVPNGMVVAFFDETAAAVDGEGVTVAGTGVPESLSEQAQNALDGEGVLPRLRLVER